MMPKSGMRARTSASASRTLFSPFIPRIVFDRGGWRRTMKALMMDVPLLITSLMRHGAGQHAQREIVSVTADDPRHRYSYGDAFCRAAQLAHALRELGLQPSDRVGTLAWNDYRHFELYYGVSCA